MKKILMFLVTAFVAVSVSAQTGHDYLEVARNVLKTEKKVAIAEVMQLDESQSKAFWDLYNEYDAALYKVENKKIALIYDYAKNYESMTDAKADELMKSSLKVRAELLKLKKKYYSKFKKFLPAGKAALFMQADNKIETLVNAEMALEIPFVEVAQ